MSPRRSRKLKIAAVWSAIVVAGALVGWRASRAQQQRLLDGLAQEARRAAVSFDANNLRQLTGTPADRTERVFAIVKARLQRLRAATPDARVLYLLRFLPAPHKAIFLATAGGTNAGEAVEPGTEYSPAGLPPRLEQVLETGEVAAEPARTDATGTWAIGYAPITIAGGEAREVLALELDASAWTGTLWSAGFQGAFYVWMLLGMPFFVSLVIRRAEEQREVIRNFSEAMEQSHSALLIVDLENNIEYANRGLCQQLGCSRRDLIGHNWRDVRVAPESEEVMSELGATVRSGRPWEGEWHIRRKDGSTYPVRGVVTPVKHRDGTLSCFVAVFDDVTEAKRRESELREARDLAEAGDRAKGQFLATMSHEVRTPLNGIVGFTSLLLETVLTSEQREYVQTIRMSTEALIQLTGDILDFARIESGKLKLEPLPCDPRECVEDALDLLAAKAAEKKLELLHRVAPDVPAAVLIDGGRLRQVLINLVNNAVKFTERGEVEVAVALAAPEEKPEGSAEPKPAALPRECTLVFSVRDTGIGIAPDFHGRLFRPFSQGDESTTRRYGGTGLGLAISRNLVRLMGGEISFSSQPGVGSTFTFSIRAPVAAPAPPPRTLGGMRIGLAMHPGTMRSELVKLLEGWNARVALSDTPGGLAGAGWDTALVELDEPLARELAARSEPCPDLPPAKTLALVPITLSNELRHALRPHCRLLINQPVHHDALFGQLSGPSPAAPLASSAPSTYFGFRVLVVEDNPVNQRLMERVLTALGCTWTVVGNGRSAVDTLAERATEFDVVLLDLHMPELDGIGALQEIRAGKAGLRAQTMWIVALTADAREEQRSRAIAAGVNDYLVKPVRLGDVAAALKRFRQERGARRY